MNACKVKVSCGLLTKEKLPQMDTVIKELKLDMPRLSAFVEQPQNVAFIAEYEGEVVGFIYGYSLMSLEASPQLFIYSVDVLPRAQNMGIGSKLFQFAVDYSKDNGFSECFVITDKGNKSACRIYEKAGGKNDFDDEIVYVIKHKIECNE